MGVSRACTCKDLSGSHHLGMGLFTRHLLFPSSYKFFLPYEAQTPSPFSAQDSV